MKKFLLSATAFLLASIVSFAEQPYKTSLQGKNVVVTSPDGTKRTYTGKFTVLYTAVNPAKELRRGDFGYIKKNPDEEGLLYNVATWGKSEKFKLDSSQHIEDGFNPEFDRKLGKNRTADYFSATPLIELDPTSAVEKQGAISWKFADNEQFSFSASLVIDQSGYPKITMQLHPKVKGWFSVGYVGAEAFPVSACEEIWQPLIWQELRFPNSSYLSEASRCPVPTGFVQKNGVTTGIVADPKYIPFNPIPTSVNSQFGILIRNHKGEAQPMLFAPILGNKDSYMSPGKNFSFDMYIYQAKTPIVKAYEMVARDFCEFKDRSSNTLTNLNGTISNMTDYCMSPYAMFIDSLRGNSYSTDVPGAVKNISGLHPLSIAIVSDNEEIYHKRALPMLEYGLSREKFLFATNPNIKGQKTSSRLNGPGVPLSDLSTTYTFSNNRMNFINKEATSIYENKKDRVLNLDEVSHAVNWQNSLHLYRTTQDERYLAAAKKGADAYLKDRVLTRQTDFNADTLSRGMFFWTSYSNQFMELYLLYLTTKESKYLDAAWDGARHFAQQCWLLPVVPDGKITVNKGGVVPRYRTGSKYRAISAPEEEVEAWRLSEIGLTAESSATSSGHRGIFMAQHAPFMMRIAAEKNDPFLRDIARAAVVGRYASFPGYHINAGRTNIFEKADFANRPLEELNAHTSLHYNHPWSQLAMLYDYLLSDFFLLSKGKIDFPAEYAEGYAYCRSLIFGGKPGHFYEEDNVKLFLPKDMLNVSNVQANYLGGYGNGKFYLALANQSNQEERVTVKINSPKVNLDPKKAYNVKVWKDNQPAGTVKLINGELQTTLSPRGLVAFAIDGVSVNPEFQQKVDSKTEIWQTDKVSGVFYNDRAVLFNFGKNLKSAYVWMEANSEQFPEATLHYAIDGKWKSLHKKGYPYDFTVSLPENANKFSYYFEGVKNDGKKERSKTLELLK